MSGFVSATTGRIVMPQKPAVRDWRKLVADAARMASRNVKVDMACAKSVKLMFFVRRPKSATRLRPTVPPDGDKLLRACLDAMKGVLYDDDAQVCEIIVHKMYETDKDAEGVQVTVADL